MQDGWGIGSMVVVWMDFVIGYFLVCYVKQMGVELCSWYLFFDGDGLDVGEIGVQVECVNVIVELVVVDVVGG